MRSRSESEEWGVDNRSNEVIRGRKSAKPCRANGC